MLSAYVQPLADRYLGLLSTGNARRGFTGKLAIMQSNCGLNSGEKTRQIPITIVESGPGSGPIGRKS